MCEIWRPYNESLGYPDELAATLLREEVFLEVCESLPLGMVRQFHACTHTTMAPTIVHGGSKLNVIPDTVDLELDVRTLPGQEIDEVYRMLEEAIGDVAPHVEIVHAHDDPSTASPTHTPCCAR